jgi:hypothetical protein
MLELVLKEKWYRMIESGEKTEEYRDIKPYWTKRLFDQKTGKLKHDRVRFSLAYGKNRPQMIFDIESVEAGEPENLTYAEQPGIYWKIKLGKRIFLADLLSEFAESSCFNPQMLHQASIKINPSCENIFIPHGSVLS